MKPLGLSITGSEHGPCFSVSNPSRVEDAVWEAVELAISSGWTPHQFRDEIASAWKERLNDDAEYAEKVLSE